MSHALLTRSGSGGSCQIMPNTIAATNPNDMIAASTFSLVLSSIGASFAGLPAVGLSGLMNRA